MTTSDIFLFVSHVSEDRSAAMNIVGELERRGVACWVAPRNVRPGKPFDDEIAEAIDASRAMLLIFSERCNENEYIRREVTVAGEAGKTIILFRIENAQPRKGLRVRLSDLHWIDGFESSEQAIDELVKTLHSPKDKIIAKTTTNQAPRKDTPRTASQARRPSRRAIGIGGLLGVALAGALVLWVETKPASEIPLGVEATPSPQVPPRVQPTPPPQAPSSPPAPDRPPPINLPVLNFTTLSPERERALQPKDSFKECSACPEMVAVPSGAFEMGSPDSQPLRVKDEGPQHVVTIKRPFAVGKFAITFDEWDACAADGGCNGYHPGDQDWGRSRRPVIYVNWADAKAYVTWLSRKTGKVYRLLSEAEREYVTRAGTTTPFWFGASISLDQANFGGADAYSSSASGFPKQTVPVDRFPPNAWGLYQVHGNIREWTEDCYNVSYRDAPSDGAPWLKGDCGRRVLRNGSWVNMSALLRSAFRGTIGNNDIHSDTIGFRVARTLLAP
jgi:formylglycine-generating enzyme required for sulfatase activity